MKRIILLAIISFGFFHQLTFACSCALPSSFCEGIVNSDGTIYADIILRGKITSSNNNGVGVKVYHKLYGDTNQNEISVNFDFCSIFTDQLEEGKEYIFALSNHNNNFTLLGCSISYLKIENEVITGKIAPGIESLNYLDLGTLDGCGDGFNLFSIKYNMSIFPNPTSDFLKIKNTSPNYSAENVQIEFLDMLGQELHTFKKEDGILAGENWIINIEKFTSGVYFLKLIANKQESIFRIIKH